MANNKIAYGLAKKHGIDTDGMAPKQVWDALSKKGVDVNAEAQSEKSEEMGLHSDWEEDLAFEDFFDDKKESGVSNADITKDEYIPKSVGAGAKNYDVKYGKKTVHLAEGSYIKNKEVIAGNGSKRDIDEIEKLVKEYGGSADKWKKVKGTGTIDNDGKAEDVEIHWYEEPACGKVKMKVKDRK